MKITIACLAAAGSITAAEAQVSPLPPVTVDAPTARPRPAATRPTAEQIRVRNELRRIARERQQQQQSALQPVDHFGPNAPDRNPYADPAAPYKGDRLAGTKFTEPLVNTPKTVTVLTKDILADKGATSLKEVGRSTAGVTLGTGEGGNAFGDRFFIRGFDARNDVFVDGVRDPGISIRENFFTEQVEILKGPASSFAGRGTTGGAINIVTKQAGDRDFYNAETTIGTDATKRVTIDANQVISPTLSVRVNAMWQNADVAGRDYVFDDRWGGLIAAKWTPTENITIKANYIHTDLNGLPDFGVPYNKAALKPWTETGVSPNTWYGFVNRDFQKARQDIGTIQGEFNLSEHVTLTNKFRREQSLLDYVGTLPNFTGNGTAPNTCAPYCVTLGAQSRYSITNVTANQTDATFKYDLGPWRHTAVLGAEVSREHIAIDNYTGLTAELNGGFSGNGLPNQSIFNPPNLLDGFSDPIINTPNHRTVRVDTGSIYLIETASYKDFLILNGGVRYDNYNIVSANATNRTEVTEGLVNWNAGITLKPLPIGSVYAAFATSANPIGAELDAGAAAYGGLPPNTPVTAIYGPQLNKAYEVGTKWELFDRHLLATAALFRTDMENARDNGQPGANAYIQGIDLGASGKITDRWSVYGGLVLMESKVTASPIAADVGYKLANIAHQSFNLLTKYQLTDQLEIGGQAIWASKIYGGTFAAAPTSFQGSPATINEIPAHWRFDAFVEYKIDKNWKAKLSVNNIFDERYYDAFYRSAVPFTFIAPGRAGYLTLTAKF